jgi:hypothetical protein
LWDHKSFSPLERINSSGAAAGIVVGFSRIFNLLRNSREGHINSGNAQVAQLDGVRPSGLGQLPP